MLFSAENGRYECNKNGCGKGQSAWACRRDAVNSEYNGHDPDYAEYGARYPGQR